MLKALFNQGYSKKFMDRIEFRRKEYYEKRRIQTIRENAMKMAHNWRHEYPTGTPLEYIRDDIIECWERNSYVGIYKNLQNKDSFYQYNLHLYFHFQIVLLHPIFLQNQIFL